MAKKTSSTSTLLPLVVLLVGVVAFRVQRPRYIADVASARVARDSVSARIKRLRGLSRQDTTALRKQARANEQEIADAEVTIAESVDIPALMTGVDALARQLRLASGPLSPDSSIASANQMAMIAAPYGAETFRVTVTGAWANVVGFVDALPARAGSIMTVPTIRRLSPSSIGDGTVTADIGISVITRHATNVMPTAAAQQQPVIGTPGVQMSPGPTQVPTPLGASVPSSPPPAE